MSEQPLPIEITEEELDKFSDLDSSNFKNDEDFQIFKVLLNKIMEKYHVSSSDILTFLKEDIQIPCSIFTKKLSPLETVVKYLKENIGLSNSKIADILQKDKKTIWLNRIH